MAKKAWWKYVNAMDLGNGSVFESSWAAAALVQKAVDDGGCLNTSNINGILDKKTDIDAIEAHILKAGGRKIYEVYSKVEPLTAAWIWEDGLVDISLSSDGFISYAAYHLDSKLVKSIHNFINSKITVKKGGQGRAYVVGSTQTGLELMTIGTAGIPFIPENYTDLVVKDYNHIVEDLKSNTPCGRVVIFDGQPGSGKSYLIRALLESVGEAIFVVLPSQMVTALAGTEILPLLLRINKKRQGANIPVIMIIEDADEVLSRRAADNISGISTILNLGDGILGSMLDIRLICTTNIDMKEIDPAIQRDGRLCRQVHVGDLNYDQSNKIFNRLTGKNSDFDKRERYTLATIYKAAKEGGWTPPKKERTVGFKLANSEPVFDEDDDDDEDHEGMVRFDIVSY